MFFSQKDLKKKGSYLNMGLANLSFHIFNMWMIWKPCLVEMTSPVRLRHRRQEAVATTLTQLARDGHAVLAPWQNPCFATHFDDWDMKNPEP